MTTTSFLPGRGPGRGRLLLLLRWGAAALILFLLLRAVSVSAIVDATRAIELRWAAAALAFSLAAQLAVAGRLKLLSDAFGLGASLAAMFRINLAALFYGMFLPAGNVAAAAVRYYRIARPREEYSAGAVVLVLDRLAAAAALCAVGVAAWLLADPIDGRAALAVMAAALVILLLAHVVLLSRRASKAAEWLAPRLPERLALASVAARSRRVPGRVLLGVAVASLVAHAFGVFAYQALAWALGLDVSLLTIAWVRSAAMLAAMLPIAVAGLGVRDATLFALLAPYGVSGGQALAFSLSVFAWTIVAVGAVGGALEGFRALAHRSNEVAGV
ncbi:MAG: lysylphosphatidylglycerol synthase transmembrane domain-containing protein [Gemmatimonadota bacterium]